MALVAQDIMRRVIAILQDAGNTRWELVELLDWMNDAVRDVCFYKPTACTETVTISLSSGTKQTLPSTAVKMVRAIRNVASGRAITPVARDELDSIIPNWHSGSVVPFTDDVIHLVQDTAEHEEFWVYPGNTGDGQIECLLSVLPATVDAPASPATLSSYSMSLDIPDLYRAPIVDYMLYRAFSKDMQHAGAGQRAALHYQNFQNALGVRQQIEAMVGANSQQSQPSG